MSASTARRAAAEAFDDGKDRQYVTTCNAMVGADYPHPETALPWPRDTVCEFAARQGVSEATRGDASAAHQQAGVSEPGQRATTGRSLAFEIKALPQGR